MIDFLIKIILNFGKLKMSIMTKAENGLFSKELIPICGLTIGKKVVKTLSFMVFLDQGKATKSRWNTVKILTIWNVSFSP